LGIGQAASTTGSFVGLSAGVVSGDSPYFAIKTRPNAGGASVERFRIDGAGVTRVVNAFRVSDALSETNACLLTTSGSSVTLETRYPTPLIFGINATEAARIPAAGGFQCVNSISVGNATPTTSGAGITFPATQSASSDANTLDDYEEGNWTVGIAFGGASAGVTYSNTTNQSTYVKIGRQVTCIGYLELTNKGSSTGAAAITGLPFTVATGEPNFGGISFGYITDMTFADVPFGRTAAGGTTIALAETTNAGVDSGITNADFANTTVLRFTLTYFV
jgi:hypothetical protein